MPPAHPSLAIRPACAKAATKKERAPNVLRLIEHFNKMSRWVCTQVVKQPTTRERARCLRLFVDLAKVTRPPDRPPEGLLRVS